MYILTAKKKGKKTHVHGHVAGNEERLAVDELVVPADELFPLVGPDLFELLVDVLVGLAADEVAAAADREVESAKGYHTALGAHRFLATGFHLVHQPFQEGETGR